MRKTHSLSPVDPLGSIAISSASFSPPRNLGRRSTEFACRRIFLPSMILDLTFLILRQSGLHGSEEFILWAGSPSSQGGVISTVVRPQKDLGVLHGEISNEVVAHVIEALDSRDLIPFAQVHTHPGSAYLSSVDRVRPLIASSGFWSIVIPHFGFINPASLHQWGVFEYDRGNWKELDRKEKAERICVDDSLIEVG